jgi:hypothetical protein
MTPMERAEKIAEIICSDPPYTPDKQMKMIAAQIEAAERDASRELARQEDRQGRELDRDIQEDMMHDESDWLNCEHCFGKMPAWMRVLGIALLAWFIAAGVTVFFMWAVGRSANNPKPQVRAQIDQMKLTACCEMKGCDNCH